MAAGGVVSVQGGSGGSVEGGSMRQKHKQSCYLFLVFIFCFGPFISTEPAESSSMNYYTASLFVYFVRMP